MDRSPRDRNRVGGKLVRTILQTHRSPRPSAALLALALGVLLSACSTFEDPDAVTLQPECATNDNCGAGETCEAGRCVTTDGCDETCEPLADACDGDEVVTHQSAGLVTETCSCDYSGVERRTDCAAQGRICRDGDCVSRCAEVDCAPPENSCDGDIAIQHTGDGTCNDDDATCDYEAVRERVDCGSLDPVQVCRDGDCVDLCAAVECPDPVNRCDGNTFVGALRVGCDPATGECRAETDRLDCETVAPACDGDVRVVYVGAGSCDAELGCVPPETTERENCEWGCFEGVCRSADMVYVDAGEFLALGTEATTLRGPFLMMAAEMTHVEFERLSGRRIPDTDCRRDACPVRGVSWLDAALIANARSQQEGLEPCYILNIGDVDDQTTWTASVDGGNPYLCEGYRLPTEAEWEYAHRAGSATEFLCGDDVTCLDASAWHAGNSDGVPQPVRGKAPNGFGLYDIAGNVAEHVYDRWAPEDERTWGVDPQGATDGLDRIWRGCHFGLAASECAAASNQSLSPAARQPTHGLRLVRSVRCNPRSCPALEPACEGDEQVLRPEVGACDWETAECAYDEQRLNCADSQRVCVEGACVDLCEEVVCPPPAPSCDGMVAVTYSGDGTCDFNTGECGYDGIERREDCAQSERACIDGACVNLCEDVDCTAPEPSCTGNVLQTFEQEGTCDFMTGECRFPPPAAYDCEQDENVCQLGACVDLCPEDACPLRDDFCDGTVQVQTFGLGACDFRSGACDYGEVEARTNCANTETVCQQGTCVDLCPENSCAPRQACTEGGTLVLTQNASQCIWETGECDDPNPDRRALADCDECALDNCWMRIEPATYDAFRPDIGNGIEITVTRPFYMMATELTQGWMEDNGFVNRSGNRGCGRLCPVDNVSHFDAVEVVNQMSIDAGLTPCYTINTNDSPDPGDWRVVVSGGDMGDPYLCEGYRFPTQGEWELAYRAGTTTRFYCGDNEACLSTIAWWANNSEGSTHPIALKIANANGLFDMSGNVAEWVHDYVPVVDAPPVGGTDPFVEPPENSTDRGFRGGNYLNNADDASAYRAYVTIGNRRFTNLGVRIVRTIHE